jgi:hypothetical protein
MMHRRMGFKGCSEEDLGGAGPLARSLVLKVGPGAAQDEMRRDES